MIELIFYFCFFDRDWKNIFDEEKDKGQRSIGNEKEKINDHKILLFFQMKKKEEDIIVFFLFFL